MPNLPDDGPELIRYVPTERLPDGTTVGYSFASPTDFKIRACVLIQSLRIIPVIFVPGIMGTNLRKKGHPEQIVWAPPNSKLSGIGSLFRFNNLKPAERQLQFVPEEAEVDDQGKIEVDSGAMTWMTEALARRRGWGEVHWDSYGELLVYLETHMQELMAEGKLRREWQAVFEEHSPRAWGVPGQHFDPLDTEVVRRLVRSSFPVYAVGYNWLESCEASAKRLVTRIGEIMDEWKPPYRCEHVLIVTHSMGGLVARRAAQLLQEQGQAERILGILHGVQPAQGAAIAYKRMKLGFDGVLAPIGGWNAAEATAVLANAPGALELLPQSEYFGGRPWISMRLPEANVPFMPSTPTMEQLLPKQDVYQEVYLQDAKQQWYGLVHSDLLDPAERNTGKVTAWTAYTRRIAAVRRFHQILGTHLHPHTYAFYGADEETSWGEIRWKALAPVAQFQGPACAGPGESRWMGAMIEDKRVNFQLQDQEAAGDGTVPADASGRAIGDWGATQCFRLKGFDHQNAFNDRTARRVTLYSLALMAQASPCVQEPHPWAK
ncbi:esterase/lipase family protein [Achromobacter ruhlandii]|uniref:esterase/lipase family protein n=1 Tax=Achromobacter ruhlandii TaxID=72557 RepID=UPI003BA2045B